MAYLGCVFAGSMLRLENSIGNFEVVDVNEQGIISDETLRIRIKVNIHGPIKKGMNVKIGSSNRLEWIPITYEKLLDFCYHCGGVGHVIDECEKKMRKEKG